MVMTLQIALVSSTTPDLIASTAVSYFFFKIPSPALQKSTYTKYKVSPLTIVTGIYVAIALFKIKNNAVEWDANWGDEVNGRRWVSGDEVVSLRVTTLV